MNTYWNGNGKHEDLNKKFDGVIPSWGMTTNPYVNLFIVASSVYYDVYNNGGCNLDVIYKNIEQYIKPFDEELKTFRFNVQPQTLFRNLKNVEKLELFLDEVLLFLDDKDLEYDKQTVYFNHEAERVSLKEQNGYSNITFGLKDECDDWVDHRINKMGYTLV